MKQCILIIVHILSGRIVRLPDLDNHFFLSNTIGLQSGEAKNSNSDRVSFLRPATDGRFRFYHRLLAIVYTRSAGY